MKNVAFCDFLVSKSWLLLITTYKGFLQHRAKQFLGSGYMDFHVEVTPYDVINCKYAWKNGIGFTVHVFANILMTHFVTCNTFFTKIFTRTRSLKVIICKNRALHRAFFNIMLNARRASQFPCPGRTNPIIAISRPWRTCPGPYMYMGVTGSMYKKYIFWIFCLQKYS